MKTISIAIISFCLLSACSTQTDRTRSSGLEQDELIKTFSQTMIKGDHFFEVKNYDNALLYYLRAMLLFPKDFPGRDRAVYMAAKCYYIKKDAKEKRFIESLKQDYPKSKYNELIKNGYQE